MKKVLILLMIGQMAEANILLKYSVRSGDSDMSWVFDVNASTFNEALEKNASNCMSVLRKKLNATTEDKLMDVIDACANPREVSDSKLKLPIGGL
jgi:hypothetical protein